MSRNITLRINTRGAWRNVVEFDKARAAEVRQAVSGLARALGTEAKWCFLHPDGHREWLATPPAVSLAKEPLP